MRTPNIGVRAENLGCFLNLYSDTGDFLLMEQVVKGEIQLLDQWQLKEVWSQFESSWGFGCDCEKRRKKQRCLPGGCRVHWGAHIPQCLEGSWTLFSLMWVRQERGQWKTTLGQHWAHSKSVAPWSFLLQWLLVFFKPYSLPSYGGSVKNIFGKTC